MTEISSESLTHARWSRLPRLLLAAALLAAASTGCVDPTGQAGAENDAAAPAGAQAMRLVRDPSELPGATAVRSSPALAADGTASADGTSVTCYGGYEILAAGSGRFVSAEFGFDGDHNGEMRARATTVGPWEQFNLCYDPIAVSWLIQARGAGVFASTELAYGAPFNAMLRARSWAMGPWEHYELFSGAGTYSFRSTSNGLFVSAEFGYDGLDNGVLRARSGAIGPWETFQLFAL